VFEKEKEVGGLCRSKIKDGFIFDYAGHLLHFRQKRIYLWIKEFFKGDLIKHKRKSSIYIFKKFIPYPFQANLFGLPFLVIRDCLLGFLKTYDDFKKEISFLAWIKKKFGDGISRYFMIPYNEKFWSFPLQKISCNWVERFVPVLNTEEVLQGAIKKNEADFGYNIFFWYPKVGGIQRLALLISSHIKNIYTSSELVRLDIKKKKLYFKDGSIKGYDILVSTIPLVELLNILEGAPLSLKEASLKLRWTSIFNLNLGIKKVYNPKYHWIYFPEKKYTFYRLGFPSNFSPNNTPKGSFSLYTEVSYLPDKKIDKENLASKIIDELLYIGIIKKRNDILVKDITDIKYGYVIYDFQHKNLTSKIINFLKTKDIYSIGRYGSWSYMTMEDSLYDGEVTAKEILNKLC
ncbi:MAG: FAD-dependent oxidoreductase, partial [Candidatus Omnitrophica bacterium]|nr:FAD-dependent oxidoreductase [Candidatus Omnitrophota bacterium]